MKFKILQFVVLVLATTGHADIVYVSDGGDNTIQVFDSTTGTALGTFANSGLADPQGLAFDSVGNLYAANWNTGTIEKFTPSGVASVFATGLNRPTGLAFDSTGNLYVASYGDNAIYEFTPDGIRSTFANTGLNWPYGLAFDAAGDLYAVNKGNNTIERFSPSGANSLFANTGDQPVGLAIDSANNVYVGCNGNTIEKFTPSGSGTVFATIANGVNGMAFDSVGNLYAANGLTEISKIAPSGTISIFAMNLNISDFIAINSPNQFNDGLVAWYPLDGNANDASGNGFNGTLYNSPTFVAGPVFGSEAIYLNGANGQYVSLPSIDLSVYNAFTISMWANIQGETADAGELLICFGEESSDPLSGPAVGIDYYLYGNTYDFSAGTAAIGATPLYINQWHRYSLVYSDAVLTGYLDGQVVGTASGSMVSSAGKAGLGTHWWDYGASQSTRFIGSISDVRIYNRALSTQEIAELSALPPIVITGSASSITANSATLTGSINPNGLATTALFQYGTSTNYSTTVQISFPYSDTSTRNVYSPTLTGLAPNTTYHFQLVAQNSTGTVLGGDQTFTTSNGPSSGSFSASMSVSTNTAPADGTTAITATVTLQNVTGTPVVTFNVDEPEVTYSCDNQFSSPAVGVESTAGIQATETITSATPGTVTITAFISPFAGSPEQETLQNTVTFTPRNLELPNSQLTSAIESLYNGTAQILDGTGGQNQSISQIASTEGPMGPYFYNLSVNKGSAAFIGALFQAAGELTGGTATTVEGILTSFLQNLVSSLAESDIDTLISDSVQANTKSSPPGGIVSTWANEVANYDNNASASLQSQEECVLSDVPQAANSLSQSAPSGSLPFDLQQRLHANQIIQLYEANQCAYLSAVQSVAENPPDTDNDVPKTLIETATITGGETLLSGAEQAAAIPDVGIGPFQFLQEELNDYNRQNYWLAVHSAVQNAVTALGGATWDISNNVNAAFEEIADCTGGTPNTVTGSIIDSCINDVYGETSLAVSGQWLPGQETEPTTAEIPTIVDVKSSITIQNTNSSGATFFTFALYSCNVNSLSSSGAVPQANVVSTYIGPNETAPVPIDYFADNNGGDPASISPVNIYVLGENSSGIFYVGSTILTVGSSPNCNSNEAIKSADGTDDSTTNVYPIGNPIRCYIEPNITNQIYQAQIYVENPFVIPLMLTVTQAIPSGIVVSDISTNGSLLGSSIVWTNCVASSNSVENSFAFSVPGIPGMQTNLPPPTITFSDTNGNTFSLQGVSANFNGLFPVQVNGSIPTGVLDVDSTMLVSVTNFTYTSGSGCLMIVLTNSSGNLVTNFSEAFSLNALDGTNLIFTLPGSLPPGSYSLTGSVSINGGTGQVLAGNYVVPEPPVALNLASTPALTTNGLNVALQAPAGNYLIEASSDLSSSANWQPIMFYSSTNASFYYNFNVPMTTNANQQFYRAMMQ
jgi:sugar lactone lactonase YvrE